MIKKICDYSAKSWKDYSGPEEPLTFKKYNVIFGQNGQGKSALAQGLREIARNYDSDSGNVRYFDRGYVKSAMQLHDDPQAVKGVVASFGDKNVRIDSQIEKLQSRIMELNSEIDEAKAMLPGLNTSVEERIDVAIAHHKGTLTIRNKSGFRNPSKDKRGEVDKWIEDYASAYAKHPEFNYSAFVGDDSFEKRKDLLDSLQFQLIEPPADAKMEEYAKASAFELSDEKIPAVEVVQWLDAGVKLHENNESTCIFCGAPLDFESVKMRVNQYLKDERTRNDKLLMSLTGEITQVLDAENIVLEKTKIAVASISGMEKNAIKLIQEAFMALRTIKELVDSKIADPKLHVDISAKDIAAAFNDLLTEERKVLSAVSKEITETNTLMDDAQLLAKGAVGYELKADSGIFETLEQIDARSAEVSDKTSELTSARNSIRELESQKEDISAYAAYLNNVFSNLGMPFGLLCDEGVYRIILRGTHELLSVEDISEGEKNLFAMVYFYFNMFMDDQQETMNPDIECIIIDDPTSSMDSPNRFYVLSLVKTLLREKSDVQIFVFTHVWDDYCELSHGRESDDYIALLEVRKVNGNSGLTACKSNLFPYKQLFREIDYFAELQDGSPECEGEALHMPNTMRRVLEEYVNLHAVNPSISAGKENVVGTALFNDQNSWDKASNQAQGKVSRLISITNVYSHKFNSSADPGEIHTAARFMMKCIRENDKTHYIAMTQ